MSLEHAFASPDAGPREAAAVLALPAAAHDLDRAEAAARELLIALGVDLRRAELRDTPQRVAKLYHEMLTPQPFRFTTLRTRPDTTS